MSKKVISLDFYRHKTVVPARSSWEKLLRWSLCSTANLEQFEERKLLRFLRILKLAKFMQRKTCMLDEWFSYVKLDRKIMNTSNPHCQLLPERYARRTKFSLFGDQKGIRLTFNVIYLLICDIHIYFVCCDTLLILFSNSKALKHNISEHKYVGCRSVNVNKTCEPRCRIRKRNFLYFLVFL